MSISYNGNYETMLSITVSTNYSIISKKILDFQGTRNSNSRTFKDQPCFQVLARPWI